jgi:hypothetical protein
MNRDFNKINKLMWLFFMELEKEVEDVNGNEISTNRTLWNILYEMPPPH